MTDFMLAGAVVLAFAALVTAHLALVAGLLSRKPRWRAPLALAVVPLAPYFGFREGMRARAVAWVVAAVAYGVAFVLASRG